LSLGLTYYSLKGMNATQAKVLEAARAAEAKLAAIARTRRPTAQETAEARAAYETAAKVQKALGAVML
jgi:hypothetical protein